VFCFESIGESMAMDMSSFYFDRIKTDGLGEHSLFRVRDEL